MQLATMQQHFIVTLRWHRQMSGRMRALIIKKKDILVYTYKRVEGALREPNFIREFRPYFHGFSPFPVVIAFPLVLVGR